MGGEDAGPSTKWGVEFARLCAAPLPKPNDQGEFPEDAEMMVPPEEEFFYYELEHVKLYAKPVVDGVQALTRIAEHPRMATDKEQRQHFNCAAVHGKIKVLLKMCELLSVGWPLARILWAIKVMDEAQEFMKDIQQDLYEMSHSDEVDLAVRLLLIRVLMNSEEILKDPAAFKNNS